MGHLLGGGAGVRRRRAFPGRDRKQCGAERFPGAVRRVRPRFKKRANPMSGLTKLMAVAISRAEFQIETMKVHSVTRSSA